MTESPKRINGEDIQEKAISRILTSLEEIETAFLSAGLIKQRSTVPPISVLGWDVISYIGLIEIMQSKDGKTVNEATVYLANSYLKDLFKLKAIRKMLHIMAAHLACTIHFPHEPGPGTLYWKEAMYALGYRGGPQSIPGFKPIKCERKKSKC